MASVEQEKPVGKIEYEPREVPESPEIPEHVEKGGVSPRASQFTAQVNDDRGKPLITNSQSTVTITLPTDEASLIAWSKGNIKDAVTWFGRFWLRAIKRARKLGWRVVGKNQQTVNSNQ